MIAVVSNPVARPLQRDPRIRDRLMHALGDAGPFIEPAGEDRIAESLVAAKGCDALAVYGGDGTLHRVLCAAVEVFDELPPIVLLRAGTMNIVAESVGLKLDAVDALELAQAGELQGRTSRRLLAIESEGRILYGFLMGNGIVASFLEVLYERGRSQAAATALLAHGAASTLVGGSLSKRLTRPFSGTVSLDGSPWPGTTWTAVAVGTVEQIGLGFRAFPRWEEGMHVVGIGGSAVSLARELPRIYRGRGVRVRGNREAVAQELRLSARGPIALMVDGEFYRVGGEVRVTLGPEVTFCI